MYRHIATISTFSILATACVSQDAPVENEETETFRAALVSSEDVSLDTEGITANGTKGQALAGNPSHIAGLTADAVVNTNTFLQGYFGVLKKIVQHTPSHASADRHVWEGEHQGKSMRITMERKDAPRGLRFEYLFEGAAAGETEMKPLFSGHITRIDTRPQFTKQGWGVLRVHFSNLNALDPVEHPVKGLARIGFRRVGNVHQVHVRMLNVKTPDNPDFPKAAAYKYTLLPQGSGALRWYARQDVMKDGAPFEDVVVHSNWRRDRSGIGHAVIANGSLNFEGTPVDHWTLMECWDANFLLGFERHATPGFERTDGMLSSCFRPVTELELPTAEDTLPDEDPEIPAAHPEEMESDTEF